MSATYLKHGRGESLNSIAAKEEGRKPASYWVKEIGHGVTAKDIATVIGIGEWHHTGSFANRTPFYDAEEIGEFRAEIIAAAKARKDSMNVDEFDGTVVVVDFYKSGRRWKADERTVVGRMKIKGDWLILPDGERIKRSGNRVKSVTR